MGDLGGYRAALADKGVQLQIDWTQTLQSVVDGGVEIDTRYGGSLDYLLQLDFDRMGFIPGGFMTRAACGRSDMRVNAHSII